MSASQPTISVGGVWDDEEEDDTCEVLWATEKRGRGRGDYGLAVRRQASCDH